jgi:hypothetical protein
LRGLLNSEDYKFLMQPYFVKETQFAGNNNPLSRRKKEKTEKKI